MTSRVQHRRATVAGAALPNLPLAVGELALNLPDGALFAGGGGAPVPLIGVRNFAATAKYLANDIVAQAGNLWVAKAGVGPKAFDPNDWGSFADSGGTATRPILLPDGSVGAPALSFLNDPTLGLWRPGAGTLAFSTNGTERMRLDAAGNLGLGVTPQPWLPSQRVIQLNGATWNAGALDFTLSVNSYFSPAGAWTYINNGFASRYTESAGAHQWFVAPAGTAGNPITFAQAMTLDNAGNLGLGVTPSAWVSSQRAIDIGSTGALVADTGFNFGMAHNAYFGSAGWIYKVAYPAALYSQAGNGGHAWLNAVGGTAGAPISWTQAMTLDNAGNLLVGTASAHLAAANRTTIEVNGLVSAIVAMSVNNAAAATLYTDNVQTNLNVVNPGGYFTIANNGTNMITMSPGGGLVDNIHGSLELGWRDIPRKQVSGAYTLIRDDKGHFVYQVSAANITLNAGVFAPIGSVVNIINAIGTAIQIVPGANVNLYLAGTLATGNRTLAPHGIATILMTDSNGTIESFWISGNVS